MDSTFWLSEYQKTLDWLAKRLAKASKARQTALCSLQVDLRTLSHQFWEKSAQVQTPLQCRRLNRKHGRSRSLLPWSQRFFLIFPRERDQEQAAKRRQRVAKATRREREKPLVTLASNLTFMQTTAVKRVKLLIKGVTNGNLANTCLSAAIFLSGGRPGEIMLWTNHLHLGGKEWFVNRGQAKACVNDGRQESRNKNTTL